MLRDKTKKNITYRKGKKNKVNPGEPLNVGLISKTQNLWNHRPRSISNLNSQSIKCQMMEWKKKYQFKKISKQKNSDQIWYKKIWGWN